MLNVLKKVEKLRQETGGEKVESLEPPKNLPDLARDIYEREKLNSPQNDDQHIGSQSFSPNQSITANAYNNSSSISKQISEPSKESVPGLDLSVVRQHLAASQSAIQSVQPVQQVFPTILQQSQAMQSQMMQPQAMQVTQPVHPQVQTVINPVTQISSQLFSPQNVQSNQSIPILNNPSTQNTIYQDSLAVNDDTGFFKEFEEHVRNNGLNNDIISELLDKNLLDHMMFYHTTKGEDMPFYASSAELSHAIKLKLEELQNFERSWISNKQKMDLMKKWGSTIESDIHLRSEELKKLMGEFRRRGAGKNTDFFHIGNDPQIQERIPDKVPNDTLPPAKAFSTSDVSSIASSVSSPVPVLPVPVSPSIASVYRASPLNENPDSSAMAKVVTKNPIIIPSSHVSSNPAVLSKYNLNNYIVNEPSKYFYAIDGQIFKSLRDLMNGLDNMSRDTFNHHVNASRNDFANWIKGVFGDFRLADAIRPQNDREGLWYFLKNNTF